jgi:hypothetical protein
MSATQPGCTHRNNTGSLNRLWMTENTSIRLARQRKNGSQCCYLLAVSAIWRASVFTSSASK